MTWSNRLQHVAVVLALSMLALSSASAARQETGSVVVRLVTDPSPPGVSWSYSGLGAPVQLGISGTERTVQGLQPGTYHLLEAAVDPAQARTLTGIACSDPSRDTTVDLGGTAAAITLTANETVTCTFTHRALGPRPAADAVRLARRYAPILRLATRPSTSAAARPRSLSLPMRRSRARSHTARSGLDLPLTQFGLPGAMRRSSASRPASATSRCASRTT